MCVQDGLEAFTAHVKKRKGHLRTGGTKREPFDVLGGNPFSFKAKEPTVRELQAENRAERKQMRDDVLGPSPRETYKGRYRRQ